MQLPSHGYHPTVDAIRAPSSPEPALLQRLSLPTKRNRRVLSITGLVAIAYLLCCAAPTGNEPLMAFAGPLPFFSILMCFVVCYTIPFSYVVAELSSAFPDDGGVAIWVLNALGPFWGFQVGFWLWLSLICACSVAPSQVAQQFGKHFDFMDSASLVLTVKIAAAIVLAIPSFFGVRAVAQLCKLLLLMVVVPYVMFTLVGFLRGDGWDYLVAVRRAFNTTVLDNAGNKRVEFNGPVKLPLSAMLRHLFFSFDGIVLISVFGGEVANPARTYGTAIFIKLALQVVSYLLPFASGVVYGTPAWYNWKFHSFLQMSQRMGPFLGFLVKISSHCSNAGFYLAGMFSQAYLLYGMAHARLLPRQLVKRNQCFDTPGVAAWSGLLALVLCLLLRPKQISSLSNVFSALCQLMVIVAVIRLRVVLPNAARPTKVPGNVVGLCVLMVFPVSVLGYMMYSALQKPQTATYTLGLVLVGFMVGFGFQKWRERQEDSRQQFPSVEQEQEITFDRAV